MARPDWALPSLGRRPLQKSGAAGDATNASLEGDQFGQRGSHVHSGRAATRATPPIGPSARLSVPFIDRVGRLGKEGYIGCTDHGRGSTEDSHSFE